MNKGMYRIRGVLQVAACLLGLASCSVYKHVPESRYLLDKVEVVSVEGKLDAVSKYKNYSYQTPNTKWLGLVRFPLRIYSMSSTKHPDRWISRTLRKIGEEPVLLDEMLCDVSVQDMKRTLMNAGYLKAQVNVETEYSRKPKAKVRYELKPGTMYVVDDIRYTIQDTIIGIIIDDNKKNSLLHEGMNLESGVLDAERSRITELLQKQGYWAFNKDYISFVADTVTGSEKAGLNMIVAADRTDQDGSLRQHIQYYVSDVNYVLMDNPNFSAVNYDRMNKIEYDGFTLHYPAGDEKPILRPSVIGSHSFLSNGLLFNTDSVSKTYSSLSRLGILSYTNIRFEPIPDFVDRLKANVYLVSQPKHSFSFEIEGTNTAGDLGAAASLSFTNRNLFRGSEQLTLKLRGAYESITNLPGYSGDTYTEYGLESNLDFPELLVPFISQAQQRRSQATSRFSLKMNTQNRPEFNKTIFSAGWSYLWSDGWRKTHRLDVIDLNYIVLPWISDNFRKEYLDPISSKNSILRYSYENLLITKFGYTFYYSNSNIKSTSPFQYSVRIGAETSGNVFYGASKLFDRKLNEEGQYEIMNIAFAQYVKHDFSFTANWKTDATSNFLVHVEYGIAYPYNNSSSLPFEKRYFAGGANSVRGWSVRELGPGTYQGDDKTIDYIKQSGDIKLGASMEYRTKMFWKLNSALFVDAGNIWTIRDYDEQPGGLFSFDTFYKEIAVAYGLGFRMDLGFLVLRVDGGMKAYNPAGSTSYQKMPLLHPNLSRDFAFHLAVGYPF